MLQSFSVFPSLSPGPAETEGVMNKDVAESRRGMNSFFIILKLMIIESD